MSPPPGHRRWVGAFALAAAAGALTGLLWAGRRPAPRRPLLGYTPSPPALPASPGGTTLWAADLRGRALDFPDGQPDALALDGAAAGLAVSVDRLDRGRTDLWVVDLDGELGEVGRRRIATDDRAGPHPRHGPVATDPVWQVDGALGLRLDARGGPSRLARVAPGQTVPEPRIGLSEVEGEVLGAADDGHGHVVLQVRREGRTGAVVWDGTRAVRLDVDGEVTSVGWIEAPTYVAVSVEGALRGCDAVHGACGPLGVRGEWPMATAGGLLMLTSRGDGWAATILDGDARWTLAAPIRAPEPGRLPVSEDGRWTAWVRPEDDVVVLHEVVASFEVELSLTDEAGVRPVHLGQIALGGFPARPVLAVTGLPDPDAPRRRVYVAELGEALRPPN